ncbi:MAG: hypothetical protein R2851_01570 [Caldilineaceae bacterium]
MAFQLEPIHRRPGRPRASGRAGMWTTSSTPSACRRQFSVIPVGCSDAIYATLRARLVGAAARQQATAPICPPASTRSCARPRLRARNDVPDLRFRLIGDGALLPAMRTLAAELALDNVEFLPPVPQPERPEKSPQPTSVWAATSTTVARPVASSPARSTRCWPSAAPSSPRTRPPTASCSPPSRRRSWCRRHRPARWPTPCNASRPTPACANVWPMPAAPSTPHGQPVITQLVEATVRGMAGLNA